MSFDKRSSLSPVPSTLPSSASRTERMFHESARTAASREHERDLRTIKNFLSNYTDTRITVAGVTRTVLARREFSETDSPESSGAEPWLCERLPGRVLRVYPSSVGDGAGNFIWPTYDIGGGTLVPATPESRFDIPVPAEFLSGWLWLECTVDDSNDYHGILESCQLKIGAAPVAGFQSRSGVTVNIAICEYLLAAPASEDFTIDPKRGFAFVLRRYGPPGSFTWDVEPS